MPRYTIGNVEVPVNQNNAANVVSPAALAVEAQSDARKEELKKAKEAAGSAPSSGSSISPTLIVGGLVAGAAYFLLFRKPKAGAKSE
jgi:FAD/FMN-containing dehydrogenase